MSFERLKDFLDGDLAMLGIPGSDTIIYKDHREVFRYQSGFDSLRDRTPVRPDALYNLYSCSKVSTGVAASQLIERGEIVLDDPLYTIFPEYRHMAIAHKRENGEIELVEAKKPITLHHLLTMTSGMTYNYGAECIKKVKETTQGRCPTVEVARAFAAEPLSFEPGERFQYSFSLDIIGAVIEEVSGMSYGNYLKKNVFEPLGMEDTGFRIPEEKVSRMACQYAYDATTKEAKEISATQNPYTLGSEFESGGAGIISSVNDYILLADALANLGVGKNGNRILSAPAVNLMRTNQLTENQLGPFMTTFGGHLMGYGYGLCVRTNLRPWLGGSLSPVGEFGWDGAKLCYFIADPENRIAVFHAEHMGAFHCYVEPRLRNIIYSCLSYEGLLG